MAPIARRPKTIIARSAAPVVQQTDRQEGRKLNDPPFPHHEEVQGYYSASIFHMMKQGTGFYVATDNYLRTEGREGWRTRVYISMRDADRVKTGPVYTREQYRKIAYEH